MRNPAAASGWRGRLSVIPGDRRLRIRVLAMLAAWLVIATTNQRGWSAPPATDSPQAARGAQAANPLNADRAYGYLKQICAIGPRISGTPGMREQHRITQAHFANLGGHVSFQPFPADNPLGGAKVPMVNMIVQWHPEQRKRILLCAHCDTRPLPDHDPDPVRAQQGKFLGANDGASGVAVLMELAHFMSELTGTFGVDFVLFDGEELVYPGERGEYFAGSVHFAREYKAHPPAYRYRWGVLLDMVGDADLQIYPDRLSASWRDTRPLVAQIWGTAQKLGVSEFIPRAKYEIRDDHLPLRNIARIPTCDIIDFDYPAWHTEADTPERCSGESLAKVGWVVYEWLKSQDLGVDGQVPE